MKRFRSRGILEKGTKLHFNIEVLCHICVLNMTVDNIDLMFKNLNSEI